MSYTFLDKCKIGGVALGSAVINGATLFGMGIAAGASTPLITTVVILGMLGDLANTAHSTLKEIRKKHYKSRFNDQILAEQRALKPAIRSLIKEVEDQQQQYEKLLQDYNQLLNRSSAPLHTEAVVAPRPEKKAKSHSVDVSSSQDQAQREAVVRKSAVRKLHQRMETLTQISKHLQDSLAQTAQSKTPYASAEQAVLAQDEVASDRYVEKPVILDVINEVQSPRETKESTTHKKEPSLSVFSKELTETDQTSKLDRVVPIAKGFFKGCLKGAAAAFGTIKAYSYLAGTTVSIASVETIAPAVIVVGLVAAAGNAFLANKTHTEELEDAEQSNKILGYTLLLSRQRYTIPKVIQNLAPPKITAAAKKETTPLVPAEPTGAQNASNLLPGTVVAAAQVVPVSRTMSAMFFRQSTADSNTQTADVASPTVLHV